MDDKIRRHRTDYDKGRVVGASVKEVESLKMSTKSRD